MKKKIFVRAAAFLLAGSLAFVPALNAVADAPDVAKSEQITVTDDSDGQFNPDVPVNVSLGEVVPVKEGSDVILSGNAGTGAADLEKSGSDVILSGNAGTGAADPENIGSGSTLPVNPGSEASSPEKNVSGTNDPENSESGSSDPEEVGQGEAITVTEDEVNDALSGNSGSELTDSENNEAEEADPDDAGSENIASENGETEASEHPVRKIAKAAFSAAKPDTIEVPVVTITSLEANGYDDDKLKVTINFSGIPKDSGSDVKVSLFISDSTSRGNQTTVSADTGSVTLISKGVLAKNRTYPIYATVSTLTGTELARSETITVSTVQLPTISKSDIESFPSVEDEATGSIVVSGVDRLVYYKSGNANQKAIEGGVIRGLDAGTYYVFLPAYVEGNTYYLSSGKQSVKITEGDEPSVVFNHINAATDSRVRWSKTELDLIQGRDTSVYVRSADESLYYIESVKITPEDGAALTFSSTTGEVFLENVTKDVTLEAVVVEKSVPTSIEVISREFNKNGIYSESNPAIQTTIRVRVLDQNGKAVPGTRVYFKADRKDVSFAYVRESGADGIAAFVHSFAIPAENGSTDAEYNPVFAFDSGFTNVLAEDTVKLVLQKKSDMVLYESQITGSLPGKNQGVVVGVPAGYELWTGEVHQGALVVGSGEWIHPTDGKFTGLSSGQHLLRLGEYYDEENGTFYFASNYADFFVPRLIREEPKPDDDTENGGNSSTNTPGTDTTPSGSGSSSTSANTPGSGSSHSAGASVTNASSSGSVGQTPFVYPFFFGTPGSNITSPEAQTAAVSTTASPAPSILPATRSESAASTTQTSPASITRTSGISAGTSGRAASASTPAATDLTDQAAPDSSEESLAPTQASTADKSSEANGKSADIQKIDDGEVALAGTLPVNDVTTQDSHSKLIIFLAILVAAAVVTVTTLLIRTGQQHKA